jgi:hypothetical protein
MPGKQFKSAKASSKTKPRSSLTPALVRGTTSSVPRSVTGTRLGFPAQKHVTMAYVSRHRLSTTTGSVSVQQFRLNSLFDPDFTGGGHQPMGFDQWSAFYNHYVVTKCTYEVEFVDVTNSVTTQSTVAFHVSDDTVIPTDLETLTELGSQTALASIYGPTVISGSVDVAAFYRRPKNSITLDGDLRSIVTASPSDIVIGSLVSQTNSQASSGTLDAIVKLVFTSVFMEPKDLVGS